MESTSPISNQINYDTTDLKLSALLLSSISSSSFEVFESKNSIKKTIRILYENPYQKEVSALIDDFINRRARADVFLYNKALNNLRDRLRD